ncbi:hypothetical protein QTQ03_17675 [Micromonospora sp. WMMA1363]|uniref:deazapurine DNA modification protein DpdA family protein n=1 Tax=Micromonospora sp. WMMA1363 TaxID=3053985 RepID=UPI00259D2061|nr:hypothetical protein [Micromonospora sp. WMMA1363]MDM4721344.1 hypothetical protein [Micromonospora sp. WMMA1363]
MAGTGRCALVRVRPAATGVQTLPRAAAAWACDSGGFTELQQYGRWTVTPTDYITRLRRYRDETGLMLWAAPQDWMCEPIVINGGTAAGQRFAGTHLTVAEHQRRTVANYAQLRERAPDLPIIPVVQGWEADDYLRCVDLYWTMLRVDLTTMPLVGIGSVCRRQGTRAAAPILTGLHGCGMRRLHGFGFKTLGLAEYGHLLTSADSMAWSVEARKLRRPALAECVQAGRHRNCANCLPYALRWRTSVLAAARPNTHPRKEAA